jgi:hypothetical protein
MEGFTARGDILIRLSSFQLQLKPTSLKNGVLPEQLMPDEPGGQGQEVKYIAGTRYLQQRSRTLTHLTIVFLEAETCVAPVNLRGLLHRSRGVNAVIRIGAIKLLAAKHVGASGLHPTITGLLTSAGAYHG